MPTSHYLQINEIMQLIVDTNPEKLLDIGVGFGKYGFLAREYLELWDGREKYHDWQRRIDGIEAFPNYITPVHEFIYDNIYVGNAIDILPTLKEKYDLILLIDVFEHFAYEEGMLLLQECLQRGRNILISVPKHIGSQGDTFGNVYETHKFQWREKHFKTMADKFVIQNISGSLVVYIGENCNDIERLWRHKRLKRTIKGFFKK